MLEDNLDINLTVNDHFEDFVYDWSEKFYFLVGGYGSSKSYHVAMKLVLKCLAEKRKVLVVREVYQTIRDSCFSLLTEIIDNMGVGESGLKLVSYTESPLRIKFKNGSQIIFRGMDDPKKLKSINGVTICWMEECSECKYAGFKELLGRLRDSKLSIHFLLSTNPVSKSNWCYKHFFLSPKVSDLMLYAVRQMVVGDVYYHHSLPEDNYFLSADYIAELDKMQTYDPDLYRVARLGRFGINGVRVLPQFKVLPHEEVMRYVNNCSTHWLRVGMDFGFETSFNAAVRMAVDDENKDLYIYWCYYHNHMTDPETAADPDFAELRETREKIKADAAEPKTIKYYRQSGFRMVPAKKFIGSRLAYTKKVKRFRHIYCSNCKNCVPVVDELAELTYKTDKDGNIIPDEFNIDPHTFSAIWYGLDDYEVPDLKASFDYGMRMGD